MASTTVGLTYCTFQLNVKKKEEIKINNHRHWLRYTGIYITGCSGHPIAYQYICIEAVTQHLWHLIEYTHELNIGDLCNLYTYDVQVDLYT